MMRIIGIDPGYAIMGYGILDYNGNRFKTVHYGSIETKAGVPMPERLKLLYDGLTEIIQEYKPDEAGGLSVSEYTPMQIKQALVGYGKAEKKQVQTMVKTILNLKEVPKPDDTADAVAAAICHAHSRNSRVIGR